MDGRLRHVTDDSWVGTLNGYRVTVFKSLGHWSVHIMHPKGYAELCAPVASLRDGGRRARAWIEDHGPPWYSPRETPRCPQV